MFKKALAIFAICVAQAVSMSAPAQAGDMTWRIQSDADSTAYLRFYSYSGRRVWPSSSQSWLLDDYATHSYGLSCRYGETICYGASTNDGSFWGVGVYNDHGCSDCCYVCDGGVVSKRLTD